MRPENDTSSALRRRLTRALRTTAALALAAALWPVQAWAVPVLTVQDASVVEGDSGYVVALFVVQSTEPAPAGGIWFDVWTTNGTADASDYDVIPGYRSEIEPGQTETVVGVAVNGDLEIEPDETFFLNIANATDATIDDAQAVGTILTDDRLPRLSIDDAVVAEGGTLDFRLLLDSPAGDDGVHLVLTTHDGTATADVDYTPLMGQAITFEPGQQEADVQIPTLLDDLSEPTEALSLSIDDLSGADAITTSAQGYIVDAPPATLPQIAVDEPWVQEGDAGLTPLVFTVTLDAPTSVPVSLDYGTDGATERFIGIRGRLIFQPGEVSKQIAVQVIGNTLFEPDGVVFLELSNPVNASDNVPNGRGVIVDDDARIAMRFNGSTQSKVGDYYNAAVSVEGGTSPYQLVVDFGALPPGLVLRNWGGGADIEGIPTQAGTYRFSITATDSRPPPGLPASATEEFTIEIQPPDRMLILTEPALLSGTQASPFSGRVFAVGGIAPYVYAVSGGVLPDGVQFNADGTLSGTPSQAGIFTVTVAAADSTPGTPLSASAQISLQITGIPLSFGPATLPKAASQTPYSVDLTATGGKPAYGFLVTAGALPAGLSLSGHQLYGTPNASGSFPITITLNDSVGATFSRDYTLEVELVPPVHDEVILPVATPGRVYGYSLAGIGHGGLRPYRFEAVGGLPPGMQLAENGYLGGTPTETGRFTVVVDVFNANDAAAAARWSFDFLVSPQTLVLRYPERPAAAAVGRQYISGPTATGGLPPYRYRLTAGALPPGLTMDEYGIIQGIPTTAGRYDVTITATDSTAVPGPNSGSREFALIVEPSELQLAPDDLPEGVAGVPYDATIVASNGVAPYRFSITAGALPPGLTLSGEGRIAGIPAAPPDGGDTASHAFTIGVTDAEGRTTAWPTTIDIASVAITPASVPDATVGQAYSVAFAMVNGVQPLAWNIPYGMLPPGLEFDAASATLSGTPQSAGIYDFGVQVTDAAQRSAIRGFRITVVAPAGLATPLSASRTLDAQSGIEASTMLLAGGGAATGATVLSVSPASAGEARIERVGDDYRLRFLPSPTFSGVAEVTYTLANAAGTSAPATITFRVAARPEPLRDARVKRLLDLQARSARRFADAQMENFRQRLERLHDAREARGFANGLRANATPVCVREVGAPPDRACARPPMARDDPDAPHAPASDPLFALWTAGTLRSANQDGRSPGGAFETDGVSLGGDYRVDGRFAFGAGVGYARDGDMSEDGDRVARSRGEALAFATYASWRPGAHGFVDLLAGWQRLSFDLRRGDAAEGAVARGRREGLQRFAAVSVGADYAHDRWRFAPYARFDLSRATLAGYAESGDTLVALTYAPLAVDASSVNAGLRIDYRRETRYGQLAPQLRVEYQRDLDAAAVQWLDYADLGIDARYRSDLAAYDRSRWLIGFGLRFDAARRWSFGVDARLVGGNGGWSDRSLQVRAERRF